MKIIDFERKGNVVRFYLGDDDCEDYWGDDWDDRSYEDNAGTVYDRFIKGCKDMMFPFDALVLEPCSGEYSSHWTKEEMKERLVPCIVIIPEEVALQYQKEHGWTDNRFTFWNGASEATRFYFGDQMVPDRMVDNTQDNI